MQLSQSDGSFIWEGESPDEPQRGSIHVPRRLTGEVRPPHLGAARPRAVRWIRYSKTMDHGIEVRPVTSSDDRDAAYAVRRVVFQDEQHVPPDLEFDTDDDTAFHVIAIVNGTVVGTGRLVLHHDYAKVGRMAVLREHRAYGVGKVLLEALAVEAVRRGTTRLVLHAQVQALGFYQRCGFSVTSDEFDEAGIPHRKMERTFAAPESLSTDDADDTDREKGKRE
jgi:predicted GNAT family N-acyltransferase